LVFQKKIKKKDRRQPILNQLLLREVNTGPRIHLDPVIAKIEKMQYADGERFL